MTFTAGRVIEFVLAKLNESTRDALFKDYARVFSTVAADYGARLMGSLEIVRSELAPDSPDLAYYIDWPDVRQFLAFHADSRFDEVDKLKREGLSYHSSGHLFTPQSTRALQLHEGRAYELWRLWIRRHENEEQSRQAQSNAEKYLAATHPVTIAEHGHDQAVYMNPCPMSDAAARKIQAIYDQPAHSMHSDGAGIDEWESAERYRAWFTRDVYLRNVHLRDSFLERFAAYEGRHCRQHLEPGGGLWPAA